MSTHQLSSFCLNFDSRGRMHELYVFFFSVDFLLQLAGSSLTPRSCWFIETLRSIKDNDFVHSEFPISALPCFSVFRMISATVIALRSKSDGFCNSWPRKINFSPSAAFVIQTTKDEKYRVLRGHYWMHKNTEWSWQQDTSLADCPFA